MILSDLGIALELVRLHAFLMSTNTFKADNFAMVRSNPENVLLLIIFKGKNPKISAKISY